MHGFVGNVAEAARVSKHDSVGRLIEWNRPGDLPEPLVRGAVDLKRLRCVVGGWQLDLAAEERHDILLTNHLRTTSS
jgi:hypothetical protein